MPSNLQIVEIGEGSDGISAKWPAADKGYHRNDVHWCERMGDRWMKETGAAQAGMSYKLDRLPEGFAGFEKSRSNDSKHLDRYVYGHPNGIFRSTNEFWPHFKNLMEVGGSIGCECPLCTGTGKSKRGKLKGTSADSTNGQTTSRHFSKKAYLKTPDAQSATKRSSNALSYKQPRILEPPDHNLNYGIFGLPQGRLPDLPRHQKRVQADEEGTPDIYRRLIDELKAVSPDSLDKKILEHMSPDWQASNTALTELLLSWKDLPRYTPRCGEVVLFLRQPEGQLEWDRAARKFCYTHSAGYSSQPHWEAGVVTQMPFEDLVIDDLIASDRKKQGVNYSGFRIEPLSAPDDSSKHHYRQHKYVPFHAIRPFSLWGDCVDLDQCDSTIKNAIALASSFCLLQPYRFTGSWPTATLFVRAAFIGHEVCQVGDLVRLAPRSGCRVTDVMQITSIRCVFVRLDTANEDDQDTDTDPYNTCVHVSGRAYTIEASRSYDGVGKTPIPLENLPSGLQGYGTWFPITDPQHPNLRIEVPFTRILGRCVEHDAVKIWFRTSTSAGRMHGFQAVNALQQQKSKENKANLSFDLESILIARAHSTDQDKRIDNLAGKSWFWADTRTEQLGLQEVNDRYVGMKDSGRGWRQLELWKRALKAMEGKTGAIEALAREREEARERADASRAKGGLLAGSNMLDLDNESSDEDLEMEEQQVRDLQEQERQGHAMSDEAANSAHINVDVTNHIEEGAGGSATRMELDEPPIIQQQATTIDLTSDDDTNNNDESARQLVMGKFLGTTSNASA